MKIFSNYLLIFIALFIYFNLDLKADQLNLIPLDTEKVKERALCLRCGHMIYFFENDMIVYLRHPPFESETWYEWWSGIKHEQPDPKFYFKLCNWGSCPLFQLYQYHWDKDSSSHPLGPLFNDNPDLAAEYPYFIENKGTGEMTLCQIWTLVDLGSFVNQYGDDCYWEGYHHQNSN